MTGREGGNIFSCFKKSHSNIEQNEKDEDRFYYCNNAFSKYHYNGFDYLFIFDPHIKYKKLLRIYDGKTNSHYITEYYSIPKCKGEAEDIINDIPHMTLTCKSIGGETNGKYNLY